MKNNLIILSIALIFTSTANGKRLIVEPTLGAYSLFAKYENEASDQTFSPILYMASVGLSINDQYSLQIANTVNSIEEESEPEPYGLVDSRYVMDIQNITMLKAAAVFPDKLKYLDIYTSLTYSWVDINMSRDIRVARISRDENGQAPGFALGARFMTQNMKAYLEYGDYFRESKDNYKSSLTGFMIGISMDLNI